MITPQEVTFYLRYKVSKTDDITKTCDRLKEGLSSLFMSNNFMKTFDLVSIENYVLVDKVKNNRINLRVLAIVRTCGGVPVSKKFLKSYIDLNMRKFVFEQPVGTTTLIKRGIHL